MTTRKKSSGTSGQTERTATEAELQRLEERRHIEAVLRKERRIRLPKMKIPALGKRADGPKAASTTPERKEPRPLTPAEKERQAERRHVETVMRNARRSRMQLKKLIPVRSRGGSAPTGPEAPTPVAANPGQPSSNRRSILALVAVGAVLACVLLGLSLSAVLQQGRLADRLATLREETSQWKDKQQTSLDKIEQALQQLTAAEEKVQAKLQSVTDAQGQIATKVGALEVARTTDSAQLQERLVGVEKATSVGLAGVASRLDSEESLAASVRELLPALQAESAGAVQTPSEAPAP